MYDVYKVAKLAPSSQVASKRGLTTFDSFIFIFTKWQNKATLTLSNCYTILFLSRVFGCRKNGSKSPQKKFLKKSEKHHGICNFYTLFDLDRYHNKMAPLRFTKTRSE